MKEKTRRLEKIWKKQKRRLRSVRSAGLADKERGKERRGEERREGGEKAERTRREGGQNEERRRREGGEKEERRRRGGGEERDLDKI